MATFEGKKLLELMAANEESVAELYREIAQNANKGRGEDFFEELAEDEDRHGRAYKNLLERYGDDEDLTADVDSEDAEYLTLLMKDNIMKDKERLIRKAGRIYTKRDIYKIAEDIERETVIYVTEIIRLFPNLAPEEMNTILREEKNHLKKILKQKYSYGIRLR